MFAETPSTLPPSGAESALGALVGGRGLIPPSMTTQPGTNTSTQPTSPTKQEDVKGMVKNQDFIIWSMVFAGVLLLAAVVFVFFDRWRKRPVGESARDVSLSLNSFKEMYENGELTEAEYERIKAKWAAKMKEKPTTVAPAVVPPTPPPDPVPPSPPPST